MNKVAVQRLFSSLIPLAEIQYDCELPPLPCFRGMSVIITQNRDKQIGVVNRQRATVQYVQNQSVFLLLPNGNIALTYPVTSVDNESRRKTSHPIVPAYALTICKAQGQTLENLILWLDCPTVPAGAAYVALSRVKRLVNLNFLVETVPSQYPRVS